MIAIYLISFLVCFVYAIIVKCKFLNLTSISESYYKVKPKWLFQVWAVGSAATLLPLWLEISPTNFEFLAFLSCVMLGVVGFAPLFKTTQFWQHMICACICLVLAITWTCLVGLWYISVISMVLSIISSLVFNFKVKPIYDKPESFLDKLMAKFHLNDTIYWVEVGALISIYLCVLIKIIYPIILK